MIGKQFKNQSFRSTLDYVLGKEKANIIDSNMGGSTPRQLAKEFGASRRLRPNLKRACGHIILSIPHRSADHPQGEYHEHLDDEQYVAIAHRWLKEMKFLGEGLNKSQYVIARHHDTDHEHIHIIASRIRMDSSVVSDSWDYRRSEVVVRQLEKEFGLSAAPCSSERVATIVKQEHGISTTVSHRAAQTQKQKHHTSGKSPVTQLLADAIDAATVDQPTVTILIGRLQQQGIVVHPQFSTQGNFKEAIAFEMDGVKVAGWKLGKAYSFPGLVQFRGVQYDPLRDLPAIRSCAAGELVELPPPATEQLVEVPPPGDEQLIEPVPHAVTSPTATIGQPEPTLEPIQPLETTLQLEYATKIAPTIRLFWQHQGRPSLLTGEHYDLQLVGKILKLMRKTGEEIALIPLVPGIALQGKGLTQEDLQRFGALQKLLDAQIKQQQYRRRGGVELE